MEAGVEHEIVTPKKLCQNSVLHTRCGLGESPHIVFWSRFY